MLKNQNPFNENRSGLSAGRFVILNNRAFVNLPFWESFVQYSPFSYRDGQLYEKDRPVPVTVDFAPTPRWISQQLSSGKIAGQIIQPHGKANLATMLFGCALQTKESKCGFCTAPAYSGPRSLEDLTETVELALAENPEYSLSINAGTLTTPGRGLEILVPYVDALRERFPDVGILLEIAPPADQEYLIKLALANGEGDLGVMLNVNFWSDAALNIVEPGKNKRIPKQAYFSAWKKSINLFGRGQVSSCVLCGIEAEEYTREAIDALTSIGVIPEVIMYRPTVGAALGQVPLDPELFLRLADYAQQKMLENKIPTAQVGCVNCGGCSLTTMTYETGID